MPVSLSDVHSNIPLLLTSAYAATLLTMDDLQCRNCHVEKPVASFPLRERTTQSGKAGEPSGTCRQCTDQQKAARAERKRKADEEAGKDGEPKGRKGREMGEGEIHDLGKTSAAGFLEVLKEMDAPIHVRAQVDVTELAPRSAGEAGKERANKLAAAMGAAQLLHWT